MAKPSRIARIAGLVGVAFTALSIACARDASAVERQHHLGLAPQLAFLKVDDKSTMSIGGGLALHYTYGLTDQFNFMAEASGALVATNQQQDTPESPRTRPAMVNHFDAGIGYVLDILRWVPYFGAFVGGYHLAGGTLPDPLIVPGAAVGVGLDYQLSHSWAVGVAGRQHFLFTELSTYPSYTTVGLRLEYMWGF